MTGCLTTWVLAAVRRNIQEFYLDISAVKISRFPQCLFTCTSLIKLELILGGNSSIVILPASMDLPRLTFMKLDSLPSTDVNSTNKLFSKCPVLECLIIEGRLGHMDLQISSLTLKHLHILDSVSKTSSKVKIDAPNLVTFKCRDYMSKLYVLENVASLVTADMDMRATKEEVAKIKDYAKNNWLLLNALSSVKELRVTEGFLCICKVGSIVSAKVSLQFSNLRFVKLETFLTRAGIRALGWLFYMSSNVESLSVMPTSDIPDSEDYWAGVSPDHLRSVEIRGLRGHFNNELKFVEIVFKKAVILENMVLFSCKKSMTDERLITFREKLPTLPRASSNVATFLI
ncbi:putative F-box/LRR-repeat protein At3g44810 [Papaver somniferum]|uniref:putative F-box/LRR-repeat protein At3g44810 n=1 Tax=Papaver somniferum TaxID=3469 RepID=UPI000E7018FE|nr:putative F-box/LRR-repeat protein At3g44810 [Papaver somniferum]